MKQIGLRSYQDIITPEEQEERDRKRYEREIYEQEKAEYLADERREKECWKIVKSFWKKQGVLKMTDEEMAVNWIRSQGWSEENLPSDEFLQMETAYLAGLKAGSPKWHKVADGDLPSEEGGWVCNQKGLPCFFDWDVEQWLCCEGTQIKTTEWCHMPHKE